MGELLKEIKKEKKKIEKICGIAEQQLLQCGEIHGGSVDVKKKHGTLQFYIKGNNKKREYIHADEKEKAEKIVRYKYYKKIEKNANKELELLTKLEKFLETQSIETVYDNMGKIKQQLINPVIIPREQYRNMWLEEEYEGKKFSEDNIEIYTDRGERVRSKSEKIIADKLYRVGIPYRYEYPLILPGGIVLYPDFTILDEINRRNIIYEHFGMMDDERYANNAIEKLQMYVNAGYHLGDNLFITMETSTKPFDSRMLDGIIEQIKK